MSSTSMCTTAFILSLVVGLIITVGSSSRLFSPLSGLPMKAMFHARMHTVVFMLYPFSRSKKRTTEAQFSSLRAKTVPFLYRSNVM